MQEQKPGRRIRIHKGLGYSPEPRIRMVSKGRYATVKSLAVCLSGDIYACGIGITLLLADLPFAYYVDIKAEARARIAQGRPPDYKGDLDLFISYFGLAIGACVIFVPILLFIALFLWLGSRKSWKMVRTMQPINTANTADLPVFDSLVRASEEPAQAQKGVLLRAAVGETQTEHERHLLRASVGSELGDRGIMRSDKQ